MAKDYQRLWMAATNVTDGAQAAQMLAEILTDKDGKSFILHLDSKDAELCVEMLGNVRPDLRLPRSQSQAGLPGYRRTRPQTCRETGILCHVEETR